MSDKPVHERYVVYKTTVNANFNYTTALNFWRAVEERYLARKKNWVVANARLVSSKLAEVRARRQLEAARAEREEQLRLAEISNTPPPEVCENALVPSGSGGNVSGMGEAPLREEFSDVDQDFFQDPGARWYR